jgi:hypothetical protein
MKDAHQPDDFFYRNESLKETVDGDIKEFAAKIVET